MNFSLHNFRCHQTDKPYKCNSCYKCFVDEAALLEHIPKHKESKHLKTHICQYCGKSYTQVCAACAAALLLSYELTISVINCVGDVPRQTHAETF